MKITGLSQKELEEVAQAIHATQTVQCRPDNLKQSRDSFESKETRSAKKIVASLSIVLSVAVASNADFSKIPFLGLSAGSGDPKIFTYCLAGVLVVFLLIYLVNFLFDRGHINVETAGPSSRIKHQLNMYRLIRKRAGLRFWRRIPDGLEFDKVDQFQSLTTSIKTSSVRQIEDYIRKIHYPATLRRWFSILEPLVLVGLSGYAVTGLAAYWNS